MNENDKPKFALLKINRRVWFMGSEYPDALAEYHADEADSINGDHAKGTLYRYKIGIECNDCNLAGSICKLHKHTNVETLTELFEIRDQANCRVEFS